MGTVVAETQSTLREIEQRLDRFFRNPAERDRPAGDHGDVRPGLRRAVAAGLRGSGRRPAQRAGVDRALCGCRRSRPSRRSSAGSRRTSARSGFFVESLGQDTERPRGMFHYDPATGMFSAELGQLPADEAVFAPADEEYHAAPRTIDMRVPEPRRTDNVETAARKTLEAAHQQAERLTHVAGDARAIGELDRLLPMLSNEADLLDNEQLKSKAARALQLLHAAQGRAGARGCRRTRAIAGAAEGPRSAAADRAAAVQPGRCRQRTARDLRRGGARGARQHRRATLPNCAPGATTRPR